MAILWEKNVTGVNYQIRTAGNTRRLYTNGVFHSQYNPGSPVGGSVWDLLMLPAFFYPPGQVQRVLVLGVGGGAVIKQLDHFLAPEKLVGVELSPVHISIAKRYFGVSGKNIDLVRADAKDWVANYNGKRFDLVIDDLFGEQDRQPVRAVAADTAWFNALVNCLTPRGALVMNFDSAAGLQKSAFFRSPAVRRRFKSAFALTTRLYENRVGAFFRKAVTRNGLLEHLAQIPALNPARKSCRLNFQLREIGE